MTSHDNCHSGNNLGIGLSLMLALVILDACGKFGGKQRKCKSCLRHSQEWLLECSPNFLSESITRDIYEQLKA